MNKNIPVYLYGSIIVLEGLFLILSKNSAFSTIQLTTGLTLAGGALVAFVAALTRYRKQVQFAYHEMHALTMLVYGFSVLFFCSSLETFISFTTFLFIFYTFSEIIFCNWIFNQKQGVVFRIIIIRVLLGFVTGIGTITALHYVDYTMQIFGSLFILVGINIILYIPVMKLNQNPM